MTISDTPRETRATSPASPDRLWQDVSEALASAEVLAPPTQTPVTPVATPIPETPHPSALASFWRGFCRMFAGFTLSPTHGTATWDTLPLVGVGLIQPSSAPRRCCQDWPEQY